MFLRIEWSWTAIHIDASVRLLPFTIDESDPNMRLTFRAFEGNWLNKNFNWTDSQNGASDADEFVN